MNISNGNCPACLKKEVREIGTKNNFTLQQCNRCQTIYALANFESDETTNEIKELYDHYYDNATFTLPAAVEMSLQNIVNSFEQLRQTGNLLDIGFGEGGMLGIAEKNNWKCYGTELSPQSLKYGEGKEWIVSKDALRDDRFPKSGFDVVTMIELIEHVPDPDFFFEVAFSMLRPGGLLFLTTPNTGSINRRWLGADWSVISPPEHITIWSPKGINEALKRNNFISKKIRTEGFNPVEILARLRAASSKEERAEVNRNEAGFALNEAFTSSSWRRALKSSINHGLSAFRLGDGIKVWAIKT